MPDLYVRAARWAGRVRGPAAVTWRRRLDTAISGLATKEAGLQRGSRSRTAQASLKDPRRLAALRRRREAFERRRDQPAFVAATRLVGLPVEFTEARALAEITAILTVVGLVPLTIVSFLFTPSVAVYLLPVVIAIPIAVYAGVLGYPESRARRLRLQSLGRAPEAVNFLALSLRLRPSLAVAIPFAAEGTEEPMAGMLRDLVWRVHLREHKTLDAAFTEFADSWRGWNDDLRRALHDLSAAGRQGSEEAVRQFCDRARDLVREGTKERLRAYAASLRAPAAMLFAFGVILPLLLGTVLPMSSLGSLAAPGLQGVKPAPGDPLLPILLLDVAFPVGTFLLGWTILGKRPAIGSSIPCARYGSWPRSFTGGAVAAVAVIPLLLLPEPLPSLVPVLSLGAGVSTALLLATASSSKDASTLRALEEGFPDALFRLGALIGAGLPVEVAVGKAAEELRGTAAGELFAAIARAMQLRRQSLRTILFGNAGLLVAHPSRLIRATLRLVVEATTRDPATASRGILETATYLRDLNRLEADMREALRSTVESVKSTAVLFAPAVLGITCALYGLLGEAFGRFTNLPMTVGTFTTASAVYVGLSVVASTYFTVGLERGIDRGEFLRSIGRNLPVALAVFTGSVLLGTFLLG